MLFTLLSVKCNNSADLVIHSHHEKKYLANAAIEAAVKLYISEQSALKGYKPIEDTLNGSPTFTSNCFHSTVDLNTDEKVIVTVSEHYSKPGRIYGSTPKSRKDTLFMIMTGSVICDIPIAHPMPPAFEFVTRKCSTVKRNTSSDKVSVYKDVVQELKQKLLDRAEKMELAATATPPTTPVTRPSSPVTSTTTTSPVTPLTVLDMDEEINAFNSIGQEGTRFYVNPFWQQEQEEEDDLAGASTEESLEYQRPRRKRRVTFNVPESEEEDESEEQDKEVAESNGWGDWSWTMPLNSVTDEQNQNPFSTLFSSPLPMEKFTWPAYFQPSMPTTTPSSISTAAPIDEMTPLLTVEQQFDRDLDEIIEAIYTKEQRESDCASEWLVSYQKSLNAWKDQLDAAAINNTANASTEEDIDSSYEDSEDDDSSSDDNSFDDNDNVEVYIQTPWFTTPTYK